MNQEEMRKQFGELFYAKRQRKGVNNMKSNKVMKDRNYFGCMLVETGEADCMISGLSKKLSRYHPAGHTNHRHRRWCKKNCGHVYHVYQTWPVVPGRYHD